MLKAKQAVRQYLKRKANGVTLRKVSPCSTKVDQLTKWNLKKAQFFLTFRELKQHSGVQKKNRSFKEGLQEPPRPTSTYPASLSFASNPPQPANNNTAKAVHSAQGEKKNNWANKRHPKVRGESETKTLLKKATFKRKLKRPTSLPRNRIRGLKLKSRQEIKIASNFWKKLESVK